MRNGRVGRLVGRPRPGGARPRGHARARRRRVGSEVAAAVFLPPAANRDYLALVDERGRVMVYRLDRPS